jgi:hypothetical protein
VILRPTVNRPVRLGVGHSSRNRNQFFYRQLWVYFLAPSLTRGWVCNLLFLLVLASAVPRDSRPYYTVPILETPPTWRARSPYLYPPGTGWPSYTSQHWVPFPSPLTSHGYGGGILSHLHTRNQDTYSGVEFKSWLGHWLSSLLFSVVFRLSFDTI